MGVSIYPCCGIDVPIHEYRFNGINTLRVVICHDKNKSHKVSVSVKNQYRIESKNLALLIFEHDDRIHNTLKDNRKRQGSEPSTPIHCWRPAGGWGVGEGGDAGGNWASPSSHFQFQDFCEVNQWSHSCLDLLLAGRCPPVPGADLHPGCVLVWGRRMGEDEERGGK